MAFGQAALNGWDRGLVGVDEADLGLPATPGDVGEPELHSSVDLLRGHAWRQRRIRIVHRRRIEADQQNPLHPTSPTKLGRHLASQAESQAVRFMAILR